ncbi:hypothetical protein FACS189431_1230 [Alphaproteobacteria bacterium]|nr:hypothetical protein FACS189431_1230 [Alphaproteobacteria bacterium]
MLNNLFFQVELLYTGSRTIMYQHFNTRKRFIKRLIAYVFMTLAVIVGVAGATVWIMGYRFNVDDRQVERISLLQFQTFPTGAHVVVDDKELSFNTPGRYDEAKPGVSSVKYWLTGYRDWTKTVNLKPAEVRWLNYARLVPNELKPEGAAQFAGFHQAINSPSGAFILLHENPASRTLKLVDISDPVNIRTSDLTIPDAILSADTAEAFTIVEWDSSSNYILVRRDVGGATEILRLDRRDMNSSLNLTKMFGVDIASPHFMGGDNNIVFGLTGTDLRRFEIGSKAISAPLVTGVTSYDLYGDGKLDYVATSEGRQTVGVYYRDKNYILQTFDDVQPTLTSFTHYYRADYLVIQRGVEMKIIARPLDDNPGEEIAVEVPNGADWLIHNGSGRFIVAGRGEQLISYDLETNESFDFTLPGLSSAPKWIDDYHLFSSADGRLVMTEFDGKNQESLVPASNFGVFSSNNEYLFSFNIIDGGVALDRTRMTIGQ